MGTDVKTAGNGRGRFAGVTIDVDPSLAECFRSAERVMSSKYSAIANYLSQQPGRICEMRFSEIEDVLGEPLPASARRWPAWWQGNPLNSPTHVQKRLGWHAAGWVVGELYIEDERVTFQKA